MDEKDIRGSWPDSGWKGDMAPPLAGSPAKDGAHGCTAPIDGGCAGGPLPPCGCAACWGSGREASRPGAPAAPATPTPAGLPRPG
jgi:hypothetical protein